MYPMVCFTCGRPLAHLWLPYFDKIHHYHSEEEEEVDLHYHSDAKFKALIDLGIGDECCRRMLISQIENVYDQIKSHLKLHA